MKQASPLVVLSGDIEIRKQMLAQQHFESHHGARFSDIPQIQAAHFFRLVAASHPPAHLRVHGRGGVPSRCRDGPARRTGPEPVETAGGRAGSRVGVHGPVRRT
ncbi:hypothetical protein GCM10010232_15870 [Streptomyces amakusaensis]